MYGVYSFGKDEYTRLLFADKCGKDAGEEKVVEGDVYW